MLIFLKTDYLQKLLMQLRQVTVLELRIFDLLMEKARRLNAKKQILSKLEAAMQGGIYVQNGLTIGKLANVLELPEYKIRQVINQALGFNNFRL